MIVKANLTKEEYEQILEAAIEEGTSISDYIRSRLGLPIPDLTVSNVIKVAQSLPSGTVFCLQDIIDIIQPKEEDYSPRLGVIGRQLLKAVNDNPRHGIQPLDEKRLVCINGKNRPQALYRVIQRTP